MLKHKKRSFYSLNAHNHDFLHAWYHNTAKLRQTQARWTMLSYRIYLIFCRGKIKQLSNCWKGTVFLFILQKKILLVSKPREKLRDARNISAHDDINIPKITQSYTRLILVHIFYCASQMPSPPPMISKTSQMQTIQSDAASRYFSIHSKVAVPST